MGDIKGMTMPMVGTHVELLTLSILQFLNFKGLVFQDEKKKTYLEAAKCLTCVRVGVRLVNTCSHSHSHDS